MNGIEFYRRKAGMTQVQLADKLGISQANVSIWESGKIFPQADKLPILAKILNCKIEDLLGKVKE